MTEFNSALIGIQAVAIIFSVLYYLYLKGRWDFSIVCAVAWIVSTISVFDANTGDWPIATFYFLMFLLFTLETYHDVLGMLDDSDNPWK